MRIFFPQEVFRKTLPTGCQLPWCSQLGKCLHRPLGLTGRRRNWCLEENPWGPQATGKLPQLLVLLMPIPLPQPASPRARQLLSQGHTWG